MVRLALAIVLLAAAPATAAVPWAELRRPLHLPSVEPGEACPVSPVDQRRDWADLEIFGGFGTGPGPVYPGVGRDGAITMVPDESGVVDGVSMYAKLYWFVRPTYWDRVLIRGQRIDGPGRLRFTGNRPSLRIRRITRRQVHSTYPHTPGDHRLPRGARGAPGYVLADNPGCYAAQMDGSRFSRVVVFEVRFGERATR